MPHAMMIGTVIQKIVRAASTIQSSSDSPVATATRSQSLVFAGYIILLALTILFTILLFRSGNSVQDAIKSDADARIREAGERIRTVESAANIRIKEIEESAAKDRRESDQKIAELAADADRSKAKIAVAQAEAARANERASDNEKEAAHLRKLAADEALARVKIEEKIAPRHLAADQLNNLVVALERFPGMRVNLFPYTGDAEISGITGEIRAVLIRSKWVITGFPLMQTRLPGKVAADRRSAVCPRFLVC